MRVAQSGGVAALFCPVGATAGDDGPAVVPAWLAEPSNFGLGGGGVAAGGAGCGGGAGDERCVGVGFHQAQKQDPLMHEKHGGLSS